MVDGDLEVVLFRLKPGVELERFLEISARATDWLRKRRGYLRRELLEDESGQWIDLVRWETREEALAAADAFEGTPEAEAIMNAVELESIQMLHPRRIAAYD